MQLHPAQKKEVVKIKVNKKRSIDFTYMVSEFFLHLSLSFLFNMHILFSIRIVFGIRLVLLELFQGFEKQFLDFLDIFQSLSAVFLCLIDHFYYCGVEPSNYSKN